MKKSYEETPTLAEEVTPTEVPAVNPLVGNYTPGLGKTGTKVVSATSTTVGVKTAPALPDPTKMEAWGKVPAGKKTYFAVGSLVFDFAGLIAPKSGYADFAYKAGSNRKVLEITKIYNDDGTTIPVTP